MTKIVLNDKQLRLLKQEALNGVPDENGVIEHVEYFYSSDEMDILSQLMDDADELVKELDAEEELWNEYGGSSLECDNSAQRIPLIAFNRIPAVALKTVPAVALKTVPPVALNRIPLLALNRIPA